MGRVYYAQREININRLKVKVPDRLSCKLWLAAACPAAYIGTRTETLEDYKGHLYYGGP